MKYIIITSLYYIWVCTFSLLFVKANSIYLDATYFVIEDAFGVLLVYFLITHKMPTNSLEIIAAWGIIFYKSLAIISEALLLINMVINPKWWTIFATLSFFINIIAWRSSRKE